MILITGATGNIGRELEKQLSKKGVALRVVTRDESKVKNLDPSIERVIGEISDAKVAERAVQGVDRILHCHQIVTGQLKRLRLGAGYQRQRSRGYLCRGRIGITRVGLFGARSGVGQQIRTRGIRAVE